jgi:hypothetical protein
MTIDEYYGAVRRLGLVQSKVPTVHIHLPTNEPYYVADPTDMTSEQRARTIERLKGLLGVGTSH